MKKRQMQKQKKKNVPDRREKKRKVFSTPCFFCPFQIKILKESALAGVALLNIVSFLFFLRFFVFLSSRSEYSFVALLVGRARARIYIYISKRAISSSFTRETRREKEREGKKTHARDDDPGGKREEEERKIESFFRSKGRLSESERRREKEREEERLLSSFQTTL